MSRFPHFPRWIFGAAALLLVGCGGEKSGSDTDADTDPSRWVGEWQINAYTYAARNTGFSDASTETQDLFLEMTQQAVGQIGVDFTETDFSISVIDVVQTTAYTVTSDDGETVILDLGDRSATLQWVTWAGPEGVDLDLMTLTFRDRMLVLEPRTPPAE